MGKRCQVKELNDLYCCECKTLQSQNNTANRFDKMSLDLIFYSWIKNRFKNLELGRKVHFKTKGKISVEAGESCDKILIDRFNLFDQSSN